MKVLLILSNGFNEIETSSIIEVLNTGGIEVMTAGIPGAQVTGAHGLTVMAQARVSDLTFDEYDAVLFPGGSAHCINTLSSSVTVQKLLEEFDKKQKWIAAINNAPFILLKYGYIVEGVKTATHDSIERKFPNPRPGPVIVDKNYITGSDTSSSIDFSLKVLEVLKGNLHAKRVKEYYTPKLPTRRVV